MTSGTAASTSDDAMSAGAASGEPSRSRAAAPATCGAAMDVPLMVSSAVSPPIQAEVMSEPGAWMSTHEPTLVKSEAASLDVVEPTVRAGSTPDGDPEQASAP